MNVRPPALASWFLNHLISGANSESLAGDLVERYQHKRSALWYWRETIIAIVGSFTAEVWRHAGTTLVVVAIALVLPPVYVRFLSHPVNIVYAFWYPRSIQWLAQSAPDPIWRTVVQLHPWAWTVTVAWFALLGSIAWVAVRARPHQRGLILTVFVLSNVCQDMPYLRVALMDWLHDAGNPMWMFGFMRYATFVLVGTPFSILLGGGFFASHSQRTP